MGRSATDLLDIGLGLARVYRSEYWSKDRIIEYQERATVQQLRYAVTHIPYYKDLEISVDSIVDTDSLQLFPKLTKRIIQEQGERLCNPAIIENSPFKSRTSGSSGEPTITWFDRKSWNFCKYALKIRRTMEGGAPWRQRQLLFDESAGADGQVNPPTRNRFGPFQQIRLSVFTPIEEQMAILLELKPTIIYGTPSGVKELCDYASARKLQMPSVPTVFLSSELITDAVRQKIEASFKGRVIGVYGSTEFKDLAHECEHGRYHTYFQSAHVESLSDNDQAPGPLLITSLVNKAMPLIRFDIGDYAQVGDDHCACGRNSPYLSNIAGREIEFLQLPDGRRISPYMLTTAVEAVPGLLKYRFIQKRDLSLQMEVVLSDSELSSTEQIRKIRRNVQLALHSDIDLPVHSVENIDRSAGGKHMIVTHLP
jgi:phenylacetate-CoA ligase